jgi:large subunit ribosomal protein L24
MHIKTGDEVVVISGNHTGKRGKILRIQKKEDRVYIEGVNVREKALARTQQSPQGGTIEREFPIHISNVLLWSEKAKKGVRTRMEGTGRDKVRVGVPCGTKFD